MIAATVLQNLSLLAGIISGLGLVVVGYWQVRKRIVQPVQDAVPKLTSIADQINATLKKGHGLTQDVEQYEAVVAANNALRQVILDSTKQLAEAAAQVASSTDELRRVRVELAQAVHDKLTLQMRVTALESEVRELKAKLEYFTHPPAFGDKQHPDAV